MHTHAGTAINLTYFLVDGIKMRENAVGPEEKNRMTGIPCHT